MRSQRLDGRVLVLGDDTRSFLTVVRSLGRAGLEVHTGWCPEASPSLKSRYIAKAHRLPVYRADDQLWLEELLRLFNREQFDLIIPVVDGAIVPLQHWRHKIESAGRCYLLNDRAFEVAFNKRKTYDLAQSLGIAVPRQRYVRSLDELQTAAEEFGFPLVVKPESSFTLNNVVLRNQVIQLRSYADLELVADGFLAGKGTSVQQHFRGVGIGVEVLSKDGEVLTAFQHERLHEPPLGGGSSYRKSVPLHPGMLAATKKLMRALDYSGVAMVEFKMNPITGEWVLIEVNARFWGSLPLSVASGLDFPRFLYEMVCLGKTSFPTAYRTNHFARNWLADFYWVCRNFRADRTDPALMTVPLRRLPKELINLFLFRESSDTFVWDDPRPAIAELRSYALQKLHPLVSRFGFIRRRMREAARSTAARATRILFICQGNVCRSPFAEQVLRRLIPGKIEVRSTGYLPATGRRSPAEAVCAASELGFDLTRHYSHSVDNQTVGWADLILFFDTRNQESLKEMFPDAVEKAHYLGAFNPAQSLEIKDPMGGGLDTFRLSYRTILALLKTLEIELNSSEIR